jgi:hypothetical protein
VALANYDELIDTISDYLLRDDQVDTFIRLAEVRAERLTSLRQRWTEQEITGLSMTAGDKVLTMPTGMIEVRWISINTQPKSFLRVVGPERSDSYDAWFQPGVPRGMKLVGLDIHLSPPPDADYPYTISGYYGITPLSEAEPVNWLLTNAPDVYLYGALREAQPYLRKPDELRLYQQLSNEALKSLNRQEKRARLGGGRLRMRPDVYTP